jgi:hypothetical protein
MLMVRVDPTWRFLVIPRLDLLKIRDAFVEAGKTREGRGRRPVADDAAKSDALNLEITLMRDEALGWEAALGAHLDRWPDALAPVLAGPGARATPLAGRLAPSPDREK